jgi:two-component system, cell cycle sensor histidine kinase and response regulator CckA
MPPLPGTETILVVDDEIAVLSLTTLMLERYGYEVLAAASAKEALHLFEVWPDIEVDLLLVDIVMPEMNGVELASRIRAIRPNLPILYFSAYSEQETLRPVIARTNPYIAKPFNSIQLTRSIRAILDAPNVAAASESG